jgi:nitrite reductase/ring-hydroxylating ferredoxin subunit
MMDMPTSDFVRACSLAELQAQDRLVLHGRHSPILLVYDGGRVFALDNRCPHMGFPLDRGSIEDGILTCHWHHARFDLASGCTFDLWADDVPSEMASIQQDYFKKQSQRLSEQMRELNEMSQKARRDAGEAAKPKS